MSIYLALPWPPSVNEANEVGTSRKTGKPVLFSGDAKRAFIKEADGMFLQQKRSLKGQSIDGPFTYHLTLNESLRTPAMDGDNRGKYALDFCQRVGLISNDKWAEGGSWAWGPCETPAMIGLWPSKPNTFHGEYCRVPEIKSEPSQCQKQG